MDYASSYSNKQEKEEKKKEKKKAILRLDFGSGEDARVFDSLDLREMSEVCIRRFKRPEGKAQPYSDPSRSLFPRPRSTWL